MATYTLISSNVLSSSAASVTFSSIPSTYTDLVLRCSTRDSADTPNTEIYIRLNGDTATNYSSTHLWGDGSTASSLRRSNTTGGYVVPNEPATYTTNTFANSEFYIPSYGVSQNKPISGFGAPETNATAASPLGVAATLWRNTAAITSITMYSANNFIVGSSFYLYGIKNS